MFSFIIHRYSGEMSEFGVKIDDIANVLWDSVSIFCFFFLLKFF